MRKFTTTEWGKPFGKTKRQRYICPCMMGNLLADFMCQEVGSVQQKNDGRWEWTVRPSKYNKRILTDKVKQGVCATLEEAKQKVEANYR